MKFSCHTSELLHAIQLVSRAIGGQQALPILGNIFIQAEGKYCTVRATDLELSITTTFEANIENEGAITIPAKAILNFAQYTSDTEVLLETVEGTQLRCSSAKSKVLLSGEAASEYPNIAKLEKNISFSLPVQPFLQALHYVTFSAAKTSLRPVLSGVYVKSGKDEVVFVATDSYRLSEYTLHTEITEEVSCIIPVKILEELKTILAGMKQEKKTTTKNEEGKDEEMRVEVTLSAQQVGIHIGSTQLLSRLIEGKFPDYKQIVPKDEVVAIDLPTSEFHTTIKRMHYFAREVNNSLTFHYEKGQIQILTPETQSGRDEALLPVEARGADAKIALSSSYLLDFLAHVQAETVTMRITDPSRPAIFTLNDEPNLLHLVMPLRMPS